MINKLPTGWKIVTIDDVFDVIRGISFPKSARTEESEHYVGCLRTANVQRTIEWDDLWKVPSSYLPSKEKLVQENDIIISTANSLNLLGKSAMVKNVPMPSTFGTFVVNLRARLDDPKYLYYYLQSRMFMEQVAEQASTTTNISNISTTKLKRLLVPIPEFSEQKRIVARIEELFSELDNGVETLRKTKQQLAVYRQAVLKDAFAHITDKKPIREMSSVVTSGSRGWAQYYSDHGAKFVRIGNLTRDRIQIDLSDMQYVDLPDGAEGKRTQLQPNDVLVSITADLGSIGLVPDAIGEAYVNQHIAMIRFNNPEQGAFMAWYLRSDYGQKDLLKNKRGGGKLGLGLDDIRDSRVPVVSDTEASKILEAIENRLSVCDSIEKTVDTALQQAEAMRQSILKKAFEGKL